jgi:hypothetical protein
MIFKERILRWAATQGTLQRFGATLLFCLIVVLCWWLFSYRTLYERYHALSREVTAGTQQMIGASSGENPVTVVPIAQLISNREQLFLELIEIATQCGVTVQGVVDKTLAESSETFRGVVYEISCSAPFEQIITFLNHLEQHQFLFPRRCRLQQSEAADGLLQAAFEVVIVQ